jgi:hypothetical protein
MLLLSHASWAEGPPSTQVPAQPTSTMSTRTATKALVSTSTTTSVPTGAVTEASVRSTSMNDVEVEACTVKVMRSLKFPQPKNAGVVVVTYPFVFQSR